MGTKCLICVVHKGCFVIAQYTRLDGYPSDQGETILKFLLHSGNIEALRKGLDHIYTPSDEELEQNYKDGQIVDEFIWREAGTRLQGMSRDKLYPSLSYGTGARILEMVAHATAEKLVPIRLDLWFVNKFCGWAYVVDLDASVLEVYSGAELKRKATSKRFNDFGKENGSVPGFVTSFSFSELPTTEEFESGVDSIIGTLCNEKFEMKMQKRKQKRIEKQLKRTKMEGND